MRTVAKFAFALATVTAVSACASKPPPAPATPPPAPVAAAPPARPMGPVPGSAEDFRVSVGDRVFFDYDQYTLRADARATLDKQAAWLKRYGAVRVLVDGNADERGTREYNLALGTRRANSVKEYLVSNGVAATRVDTVSYGKERPIATGS
ncbi:MAG: OmpA family protein, partial [Pseudomonadota bacterium]